MITEMDALSLDERQRSSWLRANRATLMLVGFVWLGMIGWELVHQRTPLFLVAMVPLIALARFGFYAYYSRRC